MSEAERRATIAPLIDDSRRRGIEEPWAIADEVAASFVGKPPPDEDEVFSVALDPSQRVGRC